MAIKKSELYASLWASCDELRGGMDASQYKDYVLVLLFIKYVSDKYAGVPYAPITVPEGASFTDMVALKGKPDIGDQINKKIIGPLAKANKLSDMPDFNDATKLGNGKEMVDRLTNLIAIFENPALNFSKNRADGDDILGDAYEYLMRHFATESGKSKGQFYTPAEVSRVMAKIIGISDAQTSSDTTVYDPTCGSGSLLLKVADEAKSSVTLYGQEKDATTSGLARMNMVLHNNPTALIAQGNTLTRPHFITNGTLKLFDYVVANPPFSDKRWSTGLDPENDPFERFKPFGVPPAKQGDYAYLLHIVRSLKSTGSGACILPHGVLFRGNSEEKIRRNLVRKGYIKGIIGLPPNLFYGTGIPACIIVVDKQGAAARKGIFMIDASRGFMKDGNKNRLRAQDIHKIVDVFNNQIEVAKYSRMVGFDEIEQNEFNLNLPRYIDSQEPEDLQDIEAHLCGGIPEKDIDALEQYWSVFPQLKSALFVANRPGYLDLSVDKSKIKNTIYAHPEFTEFNKQMNAHFNSWHENAATRLRNLKAGFNPKDLIAELSEGILSHYANQPLIDNYRVYQHLMDYWAETMQDDCYLIAADGWKAETYRVVETIKKGKKKGQQVDRGWACDLVPKTLIVERYFSKQQQEILDAQTELENLHAQLTELEEEHGADEGALSTVEKKSDAKTAWNEALELAWEELQPEAFQNYNNLTTKLEEEGIQLAELKDDPLFENLRNSRGTLTKKSINQRLSTSSDAEEIQTIKKYLSLDTNMRKKKRQIKASLEEAAALILEKLKSEPDNELFDDLRIINSYLELTDRISQVKAEIKKAESELDTMAYEKYPKLTEEEVKSLVIENKWMTAIESSIQGEIAGISQNLTVRVKELEERYESSLPQLTEKVNQLEDKVNQHLKRMGFSWT